MKFRLVLVSLLSIQFAFAQIQDSVQSHEVEIDGWKSYFDEDKEEAYLKFKRALELDSTNVLAKIGLFNSKNEHELTDKDFELTNRLQKKEGYNNIMFRLMMLNQVNKELHDSIKKMRNKYDDDYIKFKASLTDSEFKIFDEKGNIRRTGNFKNRKPYGTWKVFGYKNKLHHSYSFTTTSDTVIVNYYKADGDIVKKEWIIGNPFTNNSKKIKELIFWQENPGKEPKYLFVSKEGFKIFDSENPVKFGKTTPDNFIHRIWNPDKKELEVVIWKNGKQEPYELCEYDGTVTSETVDGVKKTFRWKDCKKILIEE
ncbi:hypothetical protein [Seonamhaeicola sp.]|uniref:hypothetical protein n=1 Tax=Seonamhaeicola sp. TaxID=1912245 RepID=UPI00260F26BF|nr:hypothetical protein [Seonamhaeicola sp.]